MTIKPIGKCTLSVVNGMTGQWQNLGTVENVTFSSNLNRMTMRTFESQLKLHNELVKLRSKQVRVFGYTGILRVVSMYANDDVTVHLTAGGRFQEIMVTRLEEVQVLDNEELDNHLKGLVGKQVKFERLMKAPVYGELQSYHPDAEAQGTYHIVIDDLTYVIHGVQYIAAAGVTAKFLDNMSFGTEYSVNVHKLVKLEGGMFVLISTPGPRYMPITRVEILNRFENQRIKRT